MYAKKEKSRSKWVNTGQPVSHAWDTEVDYYSDWNTEQSGSDDSDTQQSGRVDYYIGDDHDDHYDVHSVSTILGPEPRARWCDVEVSDDDEYADMQSLVDSDDDDRPNDLLSDETDEEEVAATDEYWRSLQPASRRTDIPKPYYYYGSVPHYGCPRRLSFLVLGRSHRPQASETDAAG